jgi:hypothetical protein
MTQTVFTKQKEKNAEHFTEGYAKAITVRTITPSKQGEVSD